MQIAIVGAGLIGLYLASQLSKKHEVFVFEKKKTIGGKACSALYSERLFKFIPEAEKFIENKIDYCVIHFPQKTIKIKFKTSFFAFQRDKIEKLLFEISRKQNVKFFFRRKIGEKELQKFSQDFDRIIGTDGASSKVRDFLKGPKNSLFFALQSFKKEKDFSNFTEVWPTKEGFLWKIPRGERVEYGIMERAKRARQIFDNFKQEYNLSLENINCAAIPETFFLPQNEKFTLCGDATGLTKPWSGGGIIWQLHLAQILISTFPDFLEYKKKAEKIFSRQIFLSRLAKRMVYFLGFKFPQFLFSEYQIDGDFLFDSVKFSMNFS